MQGRPLSYGASASTGQVYTTCTAGGGQGSCPGNYDCINGGCCPTRSFTCSLTYDAGKVCGAPSVRYYFDTTTRRCSSFTYLGCDGEPGVSPVSEPGKLGAGNSNNFGAQSDCESYCGTGGCPNGGTPARDLASDAFLDCSVAASVCPSNYECSQVIPSPSSPSAIGPLSRVQLQILISSASSQSLCCPSRAFVCSLGPYAGDSNCGSGGTNRYYFDPSPSVQACRPFVFNGCGANGLPSRPSPCRPQMGRVI